MDDIKKYLTNHKEQFKEELYELLRLPSISTSSSHKEDVLNAANYLHERLNELGLDRVKTFETEGNPIVYAEYKADEIADDAPTVLIYGHYDVQPPDPLELWDTPPFEPQIRDGKLYGRGTCDDKGQLYIHIKALETLLKTGNPPNVNIKFIYEGEEEIGSPNLTPFLEEHQDMLDCDMVLISDTAMFAEDTPSITYGLRGLAYMEVEVQGPKIDLHSGIYGGAVENPLNVLCEIVAQLKDDDGVIQIPGFYDDVVDLTPDDRKAFRELPFDEEKYKEELGLTGLHGEKGYSTLERAAARPTLDLNGIWGGYTGEGAKTVLPSKANAKISMRLVPYQDPKKIERLFTEHIHTLAPDTVEVTVLSHHGGYPSVTDLSFYGLNAAADAFEKVYGKEPLFSREGGSIPIVADFKKILGAESILMGFGLDSNAIHSPNEHFLEKDFYRGIETSAHFFDILPEYS